MTLSPFSTARHIRSGRCAQADRLAGRRTTFPWSPACSPKRRAAPALAAAGLCGLLLAGPVAAQSTDEGLMRCRAIAEPTARLACYDALPAAGRSVQGGSGTGGTDRTPAALPTAPGEAERFGLSGALAGQLQRLESAVGADFEGWYPKDRIRLANGQVWEVVDGSSAALAPRARKVVVRRGALGAFYMDFEGSNVSPRVVRIR